jgi:hypothetical protein
MAQHVVPAASRLMGTYIPGVAPQQPQAQQEEHQSEKQRGGTLFDGVQGIPTSPKAIKKYKRAACPAPKAERRQPATPLRFNF